MAMGVLNGKVSNDQARPRQGQALVLATLGTCLMGMGGAAMAAQGFNSTLPGADAHPPLAQTPATYATFQQWCNAKDTLADPTRHTVEVLLTELRTEDCTEAGRRASVLTLLNLSNRNLEDLTPMASLPLMTELILHNNSIADLGPLAQMPNLARLYLSNNQVADISPLAGA
jgi:Leucine-rich repeat (LRR) protein